MDKFNPIIGLRPVFNENCAVIFQGNDNIITDPNDLDSGRSFTIVQL